MNLLEIAGVCIHEYVYSFLLSPSFSGCGTLPGDFRREETVKLPFLNLSNPHYKSEAIIVILETAKKGASKNELKRSAKLNFLQIEKYVDFLLRQDMLAPRIQPDEAYFTTQNGLNFLNTRFQDKQNQTTLNPLHLSHSNENPN